MTPHERPAGESSGGVTLPDERPRAEARGKTAPAAASWSVLAYLAADNDLEDALLGDLEEMEQVGSLPGDVEIVAQVDRSRGHTAAHGNWTGARRYYVTRSDTPERIGSTLLAKLGETNTGDPRVVQDFLTFGAERYPARATMLILSNHGSGFYVPPAMLSACARSSGLPAAGARSAASAALPARRLRQGFFRPTREWLPGPEVLRGIAYDDGSGDCLDNRELKQVVAHAHRVLGRPLDIVGMDACLMTMLEVAYQVRDHARILVGSQELEPGPGWPYATIFGDLVARPAMTPAELGAAIVRRYAEFYGAGASGGSSGASDASGSNGPSDSTAASGASGPGDPSDASGSSGPDITQSAIDLGKLDDLVGAVDALARALLAVLPNASLEQALYRAWRRTLRFYDDLYVDLHHFAANLAGATTRRAVRQAAVGVQRAIEAKNGPIIAEAHGGPRMTPARGLSIYFPPFRDPSIFYQELDFAQRTRWAEFLEAYLTGDSPAAL